MTFEELLKKTDLTPGSFQTHENIEELKKTYPGMLNAISNIDFKFSLNSSVEIPWRKKQKKIVNVGLYAKLLQNSKDKPFIKPDKISFVKLYKPYNGQDLNNKKILIWRLGGFGDICFINPSMRYLKKKYPDCKIYFSCAKIYQSLVDNWDCIDEIVDYPIDTNILIKCNYHCTFEGVIERCKQAHYTNAYKLFSEWMGLQIPDEELLPQLKTNEQIDLKVDKYLIDNNIDDFILIQLRASTPLRTLTNETWKKIIDPLLEDGYKFIITDSPRAEQYVSDFINKYISEKYHSQIFNFSSLSKTINYTLSLLNKAKLIISPDTSLVHFCQGLNKPLLGIYGPFPGKIRLGYYSNCDWVEPKESKVCQYNGRHCFTHSTMCETTKNGKPPICYENLDHEEIYTKAKKILS